MTLEASLRQAEAFFAAGFLVALVAIQRFHLRVIARLLGLIEDLVQDRSIFKHLVEELLDLYREVSMVHRASSAYQRFHRATQGQCGRVRCIFWKRILAASGLKRL